MHQRETRGYRICVFIPPRSVLLLLRPCLFWESAPALSCPRSGDKHIVPVHANLSTLSVISYLTLQSMKGVSTGMGHGTFNFSDVLARKSSASAHSNPRTPDLKPVVSFHTRAHSSDGSPFTLILPSSNSKFLRGPSLIRLPSVRDRFTGLREYGCFSSAAASWAQNFACLWTP